MHEENTSNVAAPLLSVVIVSFNGDGRLQGCLQALSRQEGAEKIEAIVVSKRPVADLVNYGDVSLHIHWCQVSETMTVPAMRMAGMKRARAGLIALLEDDCVVAAGWLPALLSGHQSGCMALGGPVEPGPFERGIDWGVFYCEFARFLSPLPHEAAALPGNNVSYPRSVTDGFSGDSGFYEVFYHDRLRGEGSALLTSNRMAVTINNAWQLQACTGSAFHHGRAYAAQRFGREMSWRRLVYGLLSVLLPAVKTIRTASEVLSRRRADLPLLKALPWIMLFHCCWSAGEMAGYLAGPGRSAGKWV